MEVLITSHVKVFLRSKYNSYIHTARNAYEKAVMKRKNKGFRRVFRIH